MQAGAPLPLPVVLRLWPHNMLAPRGFAWVIGLSAAALALPLLAVIGRPALWGLLPFAAVALGALWYALTRNWRDRRIVEELHLSRQRVHLRHCRADGTVLEWSADPHWITPVLRARGGPVPHYLTLSGGGNIVELGAFLMPQERRALHEALVLMLTRLRSAP